MRLDASLAKRIEGWHSWSQRRITDAVDAEVRILDPDAVRERVRAEDRRRLDAFAQNDGTAKVEAVVVAGAQTVTGGSNQPGYIDGYGVVDADVVRRLAE